MWENSFSKLTTPVERMTMTMDDDGWMWMDRRTITKKKKFVRNQTVSFILSLFQMRTDLDLDNFIFIFIFLVIIKTRFTIKHDRWFYPSFFPSNYKSFNHSLFWTIPTIPHTILTISHKRLPFTQRSRAHLISYHLIVTSLFEEKANSKNFL